MEVAQNKPPRQLSEGYQCKCKHCGNAMYSEVFIAKLQDDGNYTHERVVQGTFRQSVDPDGAPIGPVIPMCNCKDTQPCLK